MVENIFSFALHDKTRMMPISGRRTSSVVFIRVRGVVKLARALSKHKHVKRGKYCYKKY